MSTIKETTLHPDGNEGVDLYPKTNINQVQELPQKLTSVENQISQLNIDKLTKPVNPSAESAVTMLADGTVGTKLLSEIGGGGSGGKSYLHEIKGSYSDGESYIVIKIINTSNTEITDDDGGFFSSLVHEGYPAYFSDLTTTGVVSVTQEGGGIYRIMGVLNKRNNQTYYVNGSYRFQMFTDTVTEL